MKKLLTLTMALVGMFLSTSSFAAIMGPLSLCVGTTTTLIDSPLTTGTWTSSMPSVATIGVSTGVVTGISPGTAMITYWGPSTSTVVVTVNASPAAISGTWLEVGCTTTFTCTTPGGTWTSLSPGIATIVSSTGFVTGIAPGIANIRYTLPTGCFSQTMMSVSSVAPDTITGPNSVCVGSTISLFSTYSSGTWTSSNPSVATISSGGVVTGVAAGTVVITRVSSTMCSTVTDTHIVTVTTTGTAGTISGPTTVGVGGSGILSSTITGGTWSSGTPSVATIGATSGMVLGVAAGTVVMTYTTTSSCGSASATYTVTVTTPNCISGNVLFTGTSYYGPVRVWLIKYNPSTLMLTAVDSQYVYCTTGTSVGYQFCGMGTDSFRVKAACDSPSTGSVGYTPTYHTSSPHWSTATVIPHVFGTNDINKHITMGYGTVTSGPGFVAGNVTTGANKGTADGAPVVGLLVYCFNNATGAILQSTYTDAAGHYSFTGLPTGTPLKIYPELMNYGTTPYPTIEFSGSYTSLTVANFIQHTVGKTITPIPAAVGSVANVTAGVNVFPNPASNTLNVQWNVANAGTGTVVIADITGRVVLTNAIDMTSESGIAPLNINGIGAGIYMVTIKANGVNYTAKIAIQ